MKVRDLRIKFNDFNVKSNEEEDEADEAEGGRVMILNFYVIQNCKQSTVGPLLNNEKSVNTFTTKLVIKLNSTKFNSFIHYWHFKEQLIRAKECYFGGHLRD